MIPVIADLMNGQSFSAKAFVFGNPTAFTDPTGFCGNAPESNSPDQNCDSGSGPLGDPGAWWDAISSAGTWIGDTSSSIGSSISDGFWKTIGGIEDAYSATANWFKEQYTSFDPPRGPSVPSAPATPVSGQSGSTTVSGGTNQRSSTESTTGPTASRGGLSVDDPGRMGLGGAWSPTPLPQPGPHHPDAIESEWGPVLDVPLAIATGGTSLGRGALIRGAERLAVEEGEVVAARGLSAGARFIGREAGEILDVTRIRIPGPVNSAFGKIDYLLGNVGSVESLGKGGFFRGVLGFSESNLGPALERHLIENFGSATVQGSRIRAVGALIGANGRVVTIQSVWQVTAEGFVDLITAVPK